MSILFMGITEVISGKLSIYCLYTMENIPIYCHIINKIREKHYLIFHVSTILIVPMEIKNKFTPNSKIKLMDQMRQVLRYHHYLMSTGKTYCDWICKVKRKIDLSSARIISSIFTKTNGCVITTLVPAIKTNSFNSAWLVYYASRTFHKKLCDNR